MSGPLQDTFDSSLKKRRKARRRDKGDKSQEQEQQQHQPRVDRPDTGQVLLDDNLMELTGGRPFPLKHRGKIFFDKAVVCYMNMYE